LVAVVQALSRGRTRAVMVIVLFFLLFLPLVAVAVLVTTPLYETVLPAVRVVAVTGLAQQPGALVPPDKALRAGARLVIPEVDRVVAGRVPWVLIMPHLFPVRQAELVLPRLLPARLLLALAVVAVEHSAPE